MADAIAELLLTEAAIDKLGARAISIEETHSVPRNASVVVRNPQRSASEATYADRAH